MTWRALAFCAVLTTACSIPVPPRAAFLTADADATEDTSGGTTDALEVADGASGETSDILEVPDGTSGEVSDTFEVADAVPGETHDSLEVTDSASGEIVDTFEVADAAPGETSDAFEVADSSSDATSDTFEVADGVLDAADTKLDAADVDLCASVSCTDLPCASQACAPTTGKCVPTAKIDGWACDDGKKCTENDACASGACTGTTKNCDDGNACTNDSCAASLGCVNTVVKAGTACDDGDACTVGDVCAGMTCAGSAGLWGKIVGGSDDRFTRVLPVSDGAVAVGAKYANFTPGNGNADFWVRKVDAKGDGVWEAAYGKPGSGTASGIVAVTDGYVIAGTNQSAISGVNQAWLLKVDLAGKQVWSTLLTGNGNAGLTDVVVDGAGFVAVGYTSDAAKLKTSAWVERVDAVGTVTWSHAITANDSQSFYALAATSGGFIAVGESDTTSKNNGLLTRLDSDGNVLWQRIYGGDQYRRLLTVAETANGFMAGGWRKSGGADPGDNWLLRTDGDGNIVWERIWGTALANELLRIVPVGDGFIATGDNWDANSFAHTSLLHIDEWGTVTDSVTFASGFEGQVTVVQDRAWIAGASNNNSGSTGAWLQVTDLWGNTSCATSGICTGYTNECDDSNSCTADLCDAAHSGCWHANLVDTSPCSSGDACTVAQTCTAGACGGGGPKLFDVTLTSAAGAGTYAGVAVAPGGFVVAGSPQNTSVSGDVRIVRTGAAGTPIWDKTYNLGSYAGSVAAVATTTSGVAVAGSVGSDSYSEDCFVMTTDDAGNMLINSELGGPGYDTGNALAITADGYAIAGQSGPAGTQNVHDMLLIRTDAAGNQLWMKTYGTVGTKSALCGLDPSTASCDCSNPSAAACTSVLFGACCSGGTGGTSQATAVAALPDGFLLAGWTLPQGASTSKVRLVRTDLAGVKLWDETYGSAATGGIVGLAVLTDGYAVSASSSAGTASLTRTDTSGAAQWTRTYANMGGNTALVALPDGFLLTCAATANAQVRTDADGNVLWIHSSVDVDSGAVALADGIAFTTTASNQFHLIRTDLWGNASCAASGTCAALNASDCDDTNPCTADLCNAAHSGCWHSNMTDGTACGYGATCSAGTCTCAPGYLSVTSGSGKVCAADGPVWGNRPYSPAGFSDNADGTVSDTDTGLTWQQADPAGTSYTWDEANQLCITSKLAGQSDWRLPTLAELSTLIDYNKLNPATTNLLQTNVSLGYWSATPLANGAGNAWSISFVVGTIDPAMLSSKNHVRCVRGTTANHSGKRFTTSANTVTDAWTELIWQRTPDAGTETPTSAPGYCSSLVIDGSTGWRLPNIVELNGIVDRSVSGPSIDSVTFPSTPSEWFWASTNTGGSAVNVWSVYFSEGKSEGNDKANTFRVRCVK